MARTRTSPRKLAPHPGHVSEKSPPHADPASRPAPPSPPTPHDKGRKKPFDIDAMMARVRTAVGDRPKAVLFELAERGYGSPFEILVACIVTIRTLEEVSLPASLKLLEVARTPAEVAKLTPGKIDELIRACTFHEPKSRTI